MSTAVRCRNDWEVGGKGRKENEIKFGDEREGKTKIKEMEWKYGKEGGEGKVEGEERYARGQIRRN